MSTTTPLFSDPVAIALIGMIGTFLTALLGLVTAYLGRQNAKGLISTQRSVEAQHSTIKALEVNTNNKMDRLLSVTGAAEFAKGLKLGSDAAGGSPAGVAALSADIQAKAAHAQGVTEGMDAEKNRAAVEKAAQDEQDRGKP
jgi:hypothetical protein